MNFLAFKNASIKIKLITSISALILAISAFVFLFFPARASMPADMD